jgi:hypothetical protein
MTPFIMKRAEHGPKPATGVHAELLVEMKQVAAELLRRIELEQAGTYDGLAVISGSAPIAC